MKKNLTRIAIGLAIVMLFLLHAIHVFRMPLLDNLESIVYDTRLRLTMPRTVDPRVVILDIDEKSLQEREKGGEGRWPWPRDRLALLLDKLFDKYGIAVVGFDVVFAERDESSGIRVLEQLGQKELKGVAEYHSVLDRVRPQLEYDDIFARKMKDRAVVLGHVFLSDDPENASRKGMLPSPVLPAGAFGERKVGVTAWSGYTANLERLQRAAASAGHINPLPDLDGITRRVPMLVEYDKAFYEPLSLAMVRTVTGQPPVVPVVSQDGSTTNYSGLEWIKAGPFQIPVDDQAAALVPYHGPKGSFRYFSLVDVLNEKVPVGALRGKIVLIGTTAPGLLDLRATPVDPVYPGVEIHANLITGILDGNIKQRPPYIVGAEFVLLLLAGVALGLLLPLLTPFKSMLVTAFAIVGVVGTNLMVFQAGNLVLPLASGMVLILLLFTFNMAYGFLVEARGTRLITGLFGQYVPPELVEEMARNPEQFNMQPRAEELSVLFADVRGFTSISETLSPEDLSVYINDYLTTMSLVIREGHRGTLDKYIGDAVMAFWGAPMADPNHAQNAVLAALDMMKQAKVLNQKFNEKGWPPFAIGVGVNSGVMRVGDMGSQIRKAYTVMGDAVNLGSRLEGITKQYGAAILIGQSTKERISGIVLREIDQVQVKGKDEPVAIYEPMGREGEVEQSRLDELKLWSQALRYYRAQDWDKAELQLINLKKISPDAHLYDVFLDRIAAYRTDPPGPEWAGVHKFDTK
ncbi:MAG: adenylate/guanylate cyclase domain-containing protein [Betaproteobacteria bacterium]|nr:adenylate/guanylate cyclase domain-containing protein [Betaproteobacteria bacterium]MDH5342696.1 adenylate/guanylate cyclase domain-containing protein [Betaproteobacteria bacterium]